MKSIKIGALVFSKKAQLTLIFGLFCTGILLGGLIAASIENKSDFNILLFFMFNIPIWMVLGRKLKKEIIEE